MRVLDDCVLIRNESRSKPLVMRPPAGEDRIVEPSTGTTSLPYPRFDLVLSGSAGVVVSIQVDATRLTPDAHVRDPPTRAPDTKSEPIALSRAQRRVLRALCEPLLTESGPRAAPATYAQIGQRIGRQPGYVRNVIKTLRESLAGYGVPGLVREGTAVGPDDFRWELARWAIRSGCVTAAHLGGDDDRG